MPVDPFASAETPWIRRLIDFLGWLAVLTTLALSVPGLVFSAKAEPVAEASGPACGVAEKAGERAAVKLDLMIERLRAEAAVETDPSDEVVALDNRGFSYPVMPRSPQPPRPR